MLGLIYPRKCVLCRKILSREETDLCHTCRAEAPEYVQRKRNIPFVANWTAMWYYSGMVRASIHRFKFGNARSYAQVYGRGIAMRVLSDFPDTVDAVTWVPVSLRRKLSRGYDQSQLVAKAVASELALPCLGFLRKIRNTPPQSGLASAAQRRANVLGAYKVLQTPCLRDKRILLIDDVITTGATASECARMLLSAGASEVFLAAMAAASPKNNNM